MLQRGSLGLGRQQAAHAALPGSDTYAIGPGAPDRSTPEALPVDEYASDACDLPRQDGMAIGTVSITISMNGAASCCFMTAGDFKELLVYYRPDGLPREQQPWLATVWRAVG